MAHLLRPWVAMGVAATTAAAVALTSPAPDHVPLASTHPPSIQVTSVPVRLSAAVQPQATAAELPHLLTDWLRTIVVPPSVGAAFPTPDFEPAVVGNSISSGIKNIYNAVEPWVEWGFEVAAYAVGWIPWVGWLSPQIMYFYYLGERIVRSITFNIADWIGGSVSFLQGLRNVAVDTINSFIYFANDQLAFWLPPLPPIPPIGGSLSTAVAPAGANLALAAVGTAERGTDPEAARQGDEAFDAAPGTGDETPATPVGTETESEPEVVVENLGEDLGEDLGESAGVDGSELIDETGPEADEGLSAEVELETVPEATDDLDSAKDLADTVDDTKDDGSDLKPDTGPDAGPEGKPDNTSDTHSNAKADAGTGAGSDG